MGVCCMIRQMGRSKLSIFFVSYPTCPFFSLHFFVSLSVVFLSDPVYLSFLFLSYDEYFRLRTLLFASCVYEN